MQFAKNFTLRAIVELNPLVPNAPFLYPLKTSENLKVFWCFYGVQKGCIGNQWVKEHPMETLTHKSSWNTIPADGYVMIFHYISGKLYFFFFFFYKYLNAFTQYFLKISLKQQFFLWNSWKSRIVKGQYSFLSATGASTLFLTHFSPVSHLYTPCKRQKNCGFLTFLVDIEIWHWLKWVKIRFLKASFENWTHDC